MRFQRKLFIVVPISLICISIIYFITMKDNGIESITNYKTVKALTFEKFENNSTNKTKIQENVVNLQPNNTKKSVVIKIVTKNDTSKETEAKKNEVLPKLIAKIKPKIEPKPVVPIITTPKIQPNPVNVTKPVTLKPTPKPDPFECYKNTKNVATLPKLLKADVKGKTIFFHETSCRTKNNGKVTFTARQACSIESAALMNPKFQVYVAIVSPGEIKNTSDVNDNILKQLQTYPNLKFVHLEIDEYFNRTPVEKLYHSGKISTSSWPVVHLADIVRFITMWRYGAIYLDLDVMVLKSFDDMEPNFTGLENWGAIAAGVMNFNLTGIGHEWVDSILKNINDDYRPYYWSYNANGAIDRLFTKVCNTTVKSKMTKERCKGFDFLPPDVFYPVSWQNWRILFEPKQLAEVLRKIGQSRTLHMWNKMSEKGNATIGKNTPYEVIAMQYCPKVYSVLPKNYTF